MDSALATYLASHDTPCPGCGYNLRGLATGQCPECGREARLHELVEQKALQPIREEIWLLKAAAIGFGLDLLVLTPLLLPDGLGFVAVLCVVLIASLGLTVSVIWRLDGVLRAPFERRPKGAPSVGAFLWCLLAWMPLLLLAVYLLA